MDKFVKVLLSLLSNTCINRLSRLVGVLTLILTAACSDATDPAAPEPAPEFTANPPANPERLRFYVERVLDGETIEIAGGTRILYLGIKAPEINPEECLGVESRARNSQLVEGKWIEIERDTSDLDPQYGYLLRAVYVDGELVNELLLREGFARASIQPPDLKFAALLLEAERAAKEARRGIWAACEAS